MAILFDSEGPVDNTGKVIWECFLCDGVIKPGTPMQVNGAYDMGVPYPHIPQGYSHLVLYHRECYDRRNE